MVDVLDGIENTISGPAVVFQINPSTAARAGFTPEEIAVDAAAILEGEPAATPVVNNDRAYIVRVRFPDSNRISLETMSNTLLTSGSGKTATLGALATITELPPQIEIRRENLQRDVAVTARLEGIDLGSGVAAVQRGRGRAAPALQHSGRVWWHLQGGTEIIPRSGIRIRPGHHSCVHRSLVRISFLRRAPGDSGVRVAFDCRAFFWP